MMYNITATSFDFLRQWWRFLLSNTTPILSTDIVPAFLLEIITYTRYIIKLGKAHVMLQQKLHVQEATQSKGSILGSCSLAIAIPVQRQVGHITCKIEIIHIIDLNPSSISTWNEKIYTLFHRNSRGHGSIYELYHKQSRYHLEKKMALFCNLYFSAFTLYSFFL